MALSNFMSVLEFKPSYLPNSFWSLGADVFQLALLTIALAIGFSGGYGVRELKSRRRRVIAREEFFRRREQRIYNSQNVV